MRFPFPQSFWITALLACLASAWGEDASSPTEAEASVYDEVHSTFGETVEGEPEGDGFDEYSTTVDTTPPVFFDMRIAFPIDDFQMGGRVGLSLTKPRIVTDIFLDFEMRPYRRAVRVRESETLEYQFREERFTVGPGFLTRFPLGVNTEGFSSAFVLGGGAGLSPAWYRGTQHEGRSTALLWFETGIRVQAPSGMNFGASYQFFPLPGASSHRLALNIGFRLE